MAPLVVLMPPVTDRVSINEINACKEEMVNYNLNTIWLTLKL